MNASRDTDIGLRIHTKVFEKFPNEFYRLKKVHTSKKITLVKKVCRQQFLANVLVKKMSQKNVVQTEFTILDRKLDFVEYLCR